MYQAWSKRKYKMKQKCTEILTRKEENIKNQLLKMK